MFDLKRSGPELLLFLLAGFLLFTGLGSHSVHNADEARYWIVIDEMMEAGRYDDFTLRGEPYFNKGPLRIGMSHLLALGFGQNPWTLRIPSALMGLAGLAIVLALGRRHYGLAASRWAGLVFLTSTQFLYIHGARSGEMDSTLIAFWWGALLAAMLARERPAALWWCGVLVGLAGLVKHVAYVAPVGATVLLWLLMSGDVRAIGWRRILLAGLLAAAIALPWHLVQIARHGMEFVNGYLGREVVERVADDYQGSYGWAFYLSVIKDGMFVWSLLLPFAVVSAVRAWRAEVGSRFLLVIAAFMVGGLMATQGDLSWYVMPVLPALALLVGRWIPRSMPWAWAVIALVLALSPSNVLVWDVHERFAIEGLIRGDLLGVLQGSAVWWPQFVAGPAGRSRSRSLRGLPRSMPPCRCAPHFIVPKSTNSAKVSSGSSRDPLLPFCRTTT
jgi:4-amino-4-deoxy-L-arabinose transferase-like glycosyltransferase